MKTKERMEEVLRFFGEHNPSPETELHYRSSFELLVAVILSAQCTDKRVNQVTPALLEAYPDALSTSLAQAEEIFPFIRSISYPNNKAKHLAAMARMLQSDFGGEVPASIEDLMRLPGVGRKTANVIASVVFHQPAMAVDTHVFRVSARLGLTRGAKTPLAAEKQLVRHIPEELIPLAHHWLILHGRYVCTARKPQCELCGLRSICRYYSTLKKASLKTKALKNA